MAGSTNVTGPMPAWKKLGLKLKQSTNADEPANGTRATIGQPDRAQPGKRKAGAAAAAAASDDYISSSPAPKKPRRESAQTTPRTGDATPQLKKKKSVAFADTPLSKTPAPRSTPIRKTPAKPALAGPNRDAAVLKSPAPSTDPSSDKKQKKKKKKTKQQQQQPTANTGPALEYLRHWASSRDSWKFNKNHQSTLIRAVFESGIPPADIGSFYDYIDDLRGAVKMRLRETALAIRLKDGTDRGPAGFPPNTPDPDGKQDAYEAALAGFLDAQQKAAAAGRKKRAFAEVDYVTTAQDADVIIKRLVKRMRAEMVIATLSDGDDTDVGAKEITGRARGGAGAGIVGGRLKMNGVTGKRRRKLRTNADDSDSSSSSSSSSSSESSDTSDSSDSDSDRDSDGETDDDGESSDSDSGSQSDNNSDSDSSGSDDGDNPNQIVDAMMDDDLSSSSSSSSSSDDESDDEGSADEAAVSFSKDEKS